MQRWNRIAALFLFGLTACALTPAASAGYAVGDQPQIHGKSASGDIIDLSQLKGKLVLIDFWATWCGPCMAEAPHMVAVNTKYSTQGMQMIGISLDRGMPEMVQVSKEKGLVWPMILDVGGKIASDFGVTGIPHTFLLGPDGKVLWEGHPANGMDAAIEKAFKEHPPQLVDPTTLAQATSALDGVEAALKGNDFTGAMKMLGKVPAGSNKDKKLAARIEAAQKDLAHFADGMLAEAEPLIQQKQYPAAVAKLKSLAAALAGTPAGAKARERLAALASDPQVKAQMDAADKAERGAVALAAAEKLKADGKNDLAYPRFKEVVAQFAGTPAAASAATVVAEYEKDPAFVKHVTGAANEGKAKAALSLANSYKGSGRNDLARKKYQEILTQFPGTPQATAAKSALAELPE